MPETVMQKRLKRWFKTRFAVLYPLGWWVLFTQYSSDASLAYSLWLIFAGMGVRVWANGYAIKMDRLTTCGPYGHLRHPLYLGSFLILLGFMLMLRIHWIILCLITLVIIGLIYPLTIRHEEEMLKSKFGKVYVNYKAKTPAFIPRLKSYQGGERWPWSLQRYINSQEYKIFIWMVVLIIVFYLKGEFLVEHEALESKHLLLIIIAFLLGLVDLSAEYCRKRSRPPFNFHPNTFSG